MKIKRYSNEEVDNLRISDFFENEKKISISSLKEKLKLNDNYSTYFLLMSSLYFISNKENRASFKKKLMGDTKLLNIIKSKNKEFYENLKNNFKESYLLKAYMILITYKLHKVIKNKLDNN